jgi:hypothetical protein
MFLVGNRNSLVLEIMCAIKVMLVACAIGRRTAPKGFGAAGGDGTTGRWVGCSLTSGDLEKGQEMVEVEVLYWRRSLSSAECECGTIEKARNAA